MGNKTNVIRIFEAFAGMGAQRKALDNIKANYEVSGMAEWYVPAIVTYQAIHNGLKLDDSKKPEEMVAYLESKTLSMNSKEPVKKGYWKRLNLNNLIIYYSAVKQSEEIDGNIFDVRTLHNRALNDVDLLTYSFPCQDLSQQGKQRGMGRDSNTRSGLLWEIEKALDATDKKKLPKYLLMENVVSLSYKKHRPDLDMWKSKLESLGYKNDLKILNSSHFGSAQARNRVFMISTLGKKISLPNGDIKKAKNLSDILDKQMDHKDLLVALSSYKLSKFKETKSKIKKARLPMAYTTFNSEAYVYDKEFIGPTLTASGANSRIKVLEGSQIRKMNSNEAFRYMGFDDRDYHEVSKLEIFSEQKKIFTCGNSISVEVLEAIFKGVIND